MDSSKIRIIVTGGTIDDLNYDKEENAPKDHKSLIPDLLKQAQITSHYICDILMQKDSRVVTDNDREAILKSCVESQEDKIIITHGTFTMPETAKYLGNAGINKTIVLFGAEIPANKENSDAFFNLGAAFVACTLLSQGVYVVMNGKVFNWDDVKKNLEKETFETEN